MMAEGFGSVLKVPGTSQVASVAPSDIFASYTGSEYIKGGTLKTGQNLAGGTVVARETATKKIVAYSDAGSGGAEIAIGILMESQDATDGDLLCNIVLGKAVMKLSKLTGLDANGIADLNGRSHTARDVFIF